MPASFPSMTAAWPARATTLSWISSTACPLMNM
jgi:hypothetical protein